MGCGGPACRSGPGRGDGRATISNGLTYATGAEGDNLEIALDVLKYFAGEEAQRIQGESGAAIPAYEGLEDSWISAFDQFDYDLNLDAVMTSSTTVYSMLTTRPAPSGRVAWWIL